MAVMARINYLDNLSDQVIKKQAVLQEKTAERNKKVTDLENSVNELVRIVTEQLTDIREDEPEIGTIPYTLAVLEEFLNQQVITLPKIIDGTRTNAENEKLIYKNEYDQLPQAVKDYFDESLALITLANKADSAEKVAAAEYKLVHDKVNDDNGDQYTELRDRIALIEEAEAIAGKILSPFPGTGTPSYFQKVC